MTETAHVAGIGGWASAVYEVRYGVLPASVRPGGASPSPLEVCLALQSPRGALARVRVGDLRAFAGDAYGVACDAAESLATGLSARVSGLARILPWSGASHVGVSVEAVGPEGVVVVEGAVDWLMDIGPAPARTGEPVELELSVAPEVIAQGVFVPPRSVRANVTCGERKVAGTLQVDPSGARFVPEREGGWTLTPRARFTGTVSDCTRGVWSLFLASKGTLVTASQCGEVEWLVGSERVGLRLDRLAALPVRSERDALEATASMTLTVDSSMVERVSDAVLASDAETVCLQRPRGRR